MAEPRILTLSELQRLVRRTLEERFALPVWVAAEIAEIKVNYSGHCYLELVERSETGDLPAAQSRAVIWRSHYGRIAARFEEETGGRLEAGIRILVRALVSYHELYGFSLQITDLDPSYTLGDMERRRQQTIAQLQREGVWEMNRQLTAEGPLQRLAVVSSASAAGYRDFCRELDRSPYRFRATLFDAVMQGAAAEESIVGALCRIAERAEEFDAVVLIRGGGSRGDLACFDGYRLANHVAQFPLPVVTGIGHDKDVSVADMVAHTALKTPTAVAVWLVERMAGEEARLESAAQALHDAAQGLLRTAELRLERLAGELGRQSGELLTCRRLRLEHLGELLPREVADFVARQRIRLDSAAETAGAHAPERILRLGFAVVRREGRTLRRAADTAPGDRLEILLADGRLAARTE